jgi:hypothetical protein
MSTETALANVLLEIDAAEKSKERVEKLNRLFDNKDFREIVIEGYLRDEIVRYTRVSVDDNTIPEARAEAILNAQAAARFDRWLRVQEQRAKQGSDPEHLEKLRELRDHLAGNADENDADNEE